MVQLIFQTDKWPLFPTVTFGHISVLPTLISIFVDVVSSFLQVFWEIPRASKVLSMATIVIFKYCFGRLATLMTQSLWVDNNNTPSTSWELANVGRDFEAWNFWVYCQLLWLGGVYSTLDCQLQVDFMGLTNWFARSLRWVDYALTKPYREALT